jgi:copper homeostasis protein
VRIEVAVDSVADALAAFAHGADRVELCARLETDGVSPRVEDVRRVVEAGLGPVAAMVREREDGYEATPADVETMAMHAAACAKAGAARVVFGVVRRDGTIDEDACARIIAACTGCEPVFHRVFDRMDDWRGALETLVRLGFRGLLLSGGESTRTPGALERLAAVREASAGRLDLLPGGGVRADNARAVADAAGAEWVHTSARVDGRLDPAALRALRAALDTPGA